MLVARRGTGLTKVNSRVTNQRMEFRRIIWTGKRERRCSVIRCKWDTRDGWKVKTVLDKKLRMWACGVMETTRTLTLALVLLVYYVVSHLGHNKVEAHVKLTFPAARKYDLDFLDSERSVPPCGMPKGTWIL